MTTADGDLLNGKRMFEIVFGARGEILDTGYIQQAIPYVDSPLIVLYCRPLAGTWRVRTDALLDVSTGNTSVRT